MWRFVEAIADVATEDEAVAWPLWSSADFIPLDRPEMTDNRRMKAR
jgi:hypothetical protein